MEIDLSGQETEFQEVLRRFLTEQVTSEYRRSRIEAVAGEVDA